MKIKQFILILTLFSLRSNYYYTATFIQPNNVKFNKKIEKRLLIRNINIKKGSSFDNREILEIFMKTNLKLLLENSNIFEDVSYYSEHNHYKNTKIIDFEFQEYSNKINPTSSLSPLSLLTFGYFGEYPETFDNNIILKIQIYNSEYSLENNSDYTFHESLGIRPQDKSAFEKMPELRAKFIIDAITNILK